MGRCDDIYNKICNEGIKAIEEFIESRKSEELFLDFKGAEHNGAGRVLSDKNKNTLAKAISGFGNSEGGVIVWGIDCRPGKDGDDVAKKTVYIDDPHKFASQLNGAVSGCTLPPHPRVLNYPISVEGNKGFVITLIDKSDLTPHQMLPERVYYIRVGSDFIKTPHDVLAGQFGRRPQPRIEAYFEITERYEQGEGYNYNFDLYIRNSGLGIGRDIYLNIVMKNEFEEEFWPLSGMIDGVVFNAITYNKHCYCIISDTKIKLPPHSRIKVTSFQFINNDKTKDIIYDLTCGCNGSSIYKGTISKSLLDQIYKDKNNIL